jgi:DNA-binding XRE family transcriptional regulator
MCKPIRGALRLLRRRDSPPPDWLFLRQLAECAAEFGWLDIADTLAEASGWLLRTTVRPPRRRRKGRIEPIPGSFLPDYDPAATCEPDPEANRLLQELRLRRDPDELQAPPALLRRSLRHEVTDLRESIGMSQSELALSSGLSRTTLWHLETLGKSDPLPRPSTLAKLAAFARSLGLNERAGWLERFGETGRRPRRPSGPRRKSRVD